MSRGRARAQTVERLENELEELMAQLEADPAPPHPTPPLHGSGLTLEDLLEGHVPSTGSHDGWNQHQQPALGSPESLSRGGAKASSQELETLLDRLGEEERQIKDDIKRMRDAYAISLRRDYLTKGGATKSPHKSPTSPSSPPPATAAAHQTGELRRSSEAADEAEAREQERQLQEAERKVTVLRKRAEEARKTIMSKGSFIPSSSSGSGIGSRGSSGTGRRETRAIIGERRGEPQEARELRELEAQLKKMEQDRDAKERERQREKDEEDQARKREEDGRVRVTLEMAKLLLREEAAKQQDEERKEEDRKLGEMKDRVERMRIMAEVKQRQESPSSSSHLSSTGPPSAPPRQFYYTQSPSSSPSAPFVPSSASPRPSLPPMPSALAGPGAVPRPNFSPRATTGAAADDDDLNSMMSDMLRNLKASNPHTDVRDVAMTRPQPPPVPPKKPVGASTPDHPPGLPADPRACGRCGKTVDEYSDAVQAMDRRWHPACFTCYSCRGELLGQQARGGGFYPRDGQPHCTGCYRRVCGQ